MKSAKILISAVLIPALLVASGAGVSDSVQKLLRKPQYGPARIGLADGAQADGTVGRVTTQFLSLHEVDTCRNLELGQIASIKWFPRPDDSVSVGDTVTLIAMVVVASPVLIPLSIVELLGHGGESTPLRGSWESTTQTPDGKIRKIESYDGNRFAQVSGVAVAKGRYEVTGQDLHLTYDGSGLMQTIPIRFDCESLVLGDQKLSAQFSTHSAQAPIVGRWNPSRDRHNSWEFTAQGTFEKRITESQTNGQIEKIKGGVRVKWLGPDAKPDEQWGVRTKGRQLFITVGGATTEYVRVND